MDIPNRFVVDEPGFKQPGRSADLPRAEMRKNRREEPSKPEEKSDSQGILSRISELIPSRNASSSDQQGDADCAELAQLRRNNHRLAERLEQLEDRSWEVRESEEIHRSLSEAFGDVVIHRNAAGDLLFRNKVFEAYFDDQQDLPDPLLVSSELDECTETGEAIATRDIQLETLQGRRWFAWTDLQVRDPQSGEVALRSVARDITQQKRSEQASAEALARAEQANAAKSRFLAMVSHEIRTPLNGIIGMAGLLNDSPMAPDQANYVDAIVSSGNTLLNLIEDLLDTARIESGHIDLTPRPTDPRRLVEDVAELLAPAAREKGLDLSTYLSPELPAQLVLDPGRMRQILFNLLGNAVKFTKTGGVSIDVAMAEPNGAMVAAQENGESTEQHVIFTVRDSGPGLAKEDQMRIFEEFVQTDEGATREYGGAGLGLAISKNLVELMGGSIRVSSRLGKGTTFELKIALDTSDGMDHKFTAQPTLDLQVALISNRTPARRALVQSVRALGANVNSFDSLAAFELNHDESAKYDILMAPFGDWPRDQLSRFAARSDMAKRLINITDGSTAGRKIGDDFQVHGWVTQPVRQISLWRVLANKLPGNQAEEVDQIANMCPQDPMNILLAEDNPINAMLAKALLNKLGHRVIHVLDGAQALEAVEGHHFDLVLMDLHMPIMDGLTALRAIRRFEGPKAITPIVVLSADGQQEAKEEALKSGAQDFLLKPLDQDALFDILDHFARRRKLLPKTPMSLQ